MAIGLLIIGDEILSGKRADRHLPKVIEILRERGLQLGWAQYLGDEPARIVATLRQTLASGDIVFSCGGIGSTPDDHTRRCAAEALGVPLELHPFAKERILERIANMAQEAGKPIALDAPENRNRMKMGEFPRGAGAVPNQFNGIPGFSVGTHYFVPGFPEMAWSMIEWALDTYHADLFHRASQLEKSVIVYGVMESALTPLMEAIEADFPQVKTFSLPKVKTESSRACIELGVKGNAAQVAPAFDRVLGWMHEQCAEYEAGAA
ncbi:MAG: competence/damage-inducible protein [Burkholderiaceae bacterium]|nr:competence/damage-inducible protein [Burkholderiaceae bacterium]